MNTDICENNHGGNAESVEAFGDGERFKRASNAIITLLGKHPAGLTCDEVAVFLTMPSQTASARYSELKRDKRIVPTNIRRATRTGHTARVFILAT